ncbi:hypothetical protein [Streptomyces sp. NPDC056682]|uniref:hypothetical protein n=1 Tax=Streptomyces sp. NPDC056682 TaxID=3345909 RepID=UPI0036786233
MDDLDGPVTGDCLVDAPTVAVPLHLARDACALLQRIADAKGAADADDVYEARQLAGGLAYRLPAVGE